MTNAGDELLHGHLYGRGRLYASRTACQADVVVKRENVAPAITHKFRSIFDHLGKHTLIEYKGVTDDLEPADVFTLSSYAGLYMHERQVYEPNEMCLTRAVIRARIGR